MCNLVTKHLYTEKMDMNLTEGMSDMGKIAGVGFDTDRLVENKTLYTIK